ncbi:MAG: O-antigen ligase family protein [Planctomycetes bacterium]|nr:O-antigen ligase family protein [Planctomycetota bacterium]
MNDPEQPAAPPTWLLWSFLVLLVVPFHPYWVDFEQLRRALLLLLSGATLLFLPRLRPVAGGFFVSMFVLGLILCAGVNWFADAIGKGEHEAHSFQPMEAGYRLVHWVALMVVLRLGAAAQDRFGKPIAALLLATCAFGLLQRLGLGEIAGYGVDREPVSVFGNLNVASEWTAIAGAAVAALLPPSRLALASLGLAGAYLAVNGSRSGLIALPVALILLVLLRRRRAGAAAPLLPSALPLAAAAGGALLGWLLALVATTHAPTDQQAQIAAQKRSTATLSVRFEIAKGATRLFAESPVFGQGPGQFAVQYPRVRSAEEIELSSNGRQFATEVRTAHDDWLELLVDGGLPCFFLFAAALFALQRGQRDKTRLVPLFALLMMMLVRAPLLNAPAVAVAMLLVGAPAAAPPRARAWVWRLTGALMVMLAVPPIAAQMAFAGYVRAKALGQDPPLAAATAAARWMPWEPRWLQVQAQEQLAAGNLPAARVSAARALQLRPFDPQLALLLGEVLARGTAYKEAARIALFALDNDPQNPELRVLLSTVLLLGGEPDAAVDAVVVEPHPVLRAQLRHHFRSLAEQAAARGDDRGAARMRVEQYFLEALEGLGDTSEGALDATTTRIRQLIAALATTERMRTDLRGYAISALHALDLGDAEYAQTLGQKADELGVDLLPWQRALFGEQLQRLAGVRSWAPVLRR